MRLILCALCLLAASICGACGGSTPQPTTSSAPAANATTQSASAQNVGTNADAPVAGPAHAKAAPAPPGGGGEAIDTTKYDAEIARLQKQAEKRAGGESEQSALAHAYLERANALTKARQYRAALGDYRRTLKYDPANDEAKQMAGTIVAILRQMGRDVPAEGAEPSPLPYKQ